MTIGKFFCDICGDEVADRNDLEGWLAIGNGIEINIRAICSPCIQDFIEHLRGLGWKGEVEKGAIKE